jgi:hypothetical protein
LISLLISSCSSDPISNNPPSDGYTTVYYKAGVQDSLPCGTLLYDALDLGNLDLSHSEDIKITFDYIAYNYTDYRFYMYYFDEFVSQQVILFDLQGSESQNTYKSVEYIIPSPNSEKIIYYVPHSTGNNCYISIRNLKISKK